MNNRCIFFLIMTVFFQLSYTDPGCMDRSKHAYYCNDGKDVCDTRYDDMKQWHPVPCSCPCWKYKPSSRRNRCVYCNHYHDPSVNAEAAQVMHYPSITLHKHHLYKSRPMQYVPKKVQRCQD